MTDSKKPAAKGKGRPTPSRKAAEAANIRPLVGAKTPEARKAQKAKLNEERAKARAGLMAGDERYLTARDKGPQRRMARDLVDSRRFTVGELLIPSLFAVILSNSVQSDIVQVAGLLFLWSLLFAIVVDAALIGRNVKRQITKRFGSVERGVVWYSASRSFQMRPMRLPKPQVKRGQKL